MRVATIKAPKVGKVSSETSVEMLRTEEAAVILGITRVRVNQLIAQYIHSKGETGIRAENVGPRMWLCYRDSVEDYARNRRPAGRPKEKDSPPPRRRRR